MSDSPIRVAVITGSTRPNRHSDSVADWVLGRAALRTDIEAELVDLAKINLPIYDEPMPPITGQYAHEHTREWAATIAAFDAFIFVTPEYNRSIPAVLKNAIDFLYAEWNDKAAGFVSYGADAGGARAIEHLRVVLGELHVAAVRTMVPLSLIHDFEDFTRLTPGESARAKTAEMLAQVASWGRAMRTVRREGAAALSS